jgi:hypothetical protein
MSLLNELAATHDWVPILTATLWAIRLAGAVATAVRHTRPADRTPDRSCHCRCCSRIEPKG